MSKIKTKKYSKEELLKLSHYLGYYKLEESFRHTPEVFKEVFEDKKSWPVFILKNFLARDVLYILGLKAQGLETDDFGFRYLKRGLLGFENYFDASGNEIKFEVDKFGVVSDACLNKLGIFLINNLVETLEKQMEVSEEEQNFFEQSPSV